MHGTLKELEELLTAVAAKLEQHGEVELAAQVRAYLQQPQPPQQPQPQPQPPQQPALLLAAYGGKRGRHRGGRLRNL